MTDDDRRLAAIDTAWHIHAAVADWTRGVDSKASFVLTIEVALLAGVISLMGEGRRLAHLVGPLNNGLLFTGIAGLAVALVLVTLAVRPRTRSSTTRVEAPDNFVYFGHLNYRTADEVERALENDDLLPVMSRQLVVMGRIAWAKHILLKWSLTTATLGTLLVTTAAALAY